MRKRKVPYLVLYVSEYAQDTKGGSGGLRNRYEGLVDAREVTPDSHQIKVIRAEDSYCTEEYVEQSGVRESWFAAV